MPRITLAERVDALRAAVKSGAGLLPAATLAEAAAVVERASQRSQLSAEHTVVALAGATGAGKSSLFNALVGAPIARTSTQRPTTAHAFAAVVEGAPDSGGSSDGAAPLLHWLDVPERHELPVSARHPHGLILLDLPDHDSIIATHRERAEHITERADLIVWVTNPQKYADAALHSRYLRPLAGSEAPMVLVLNQIDRLSAADRAACLADLERLAAADGLRARVLGTSAKTGDGLAELDDLVVRAVKRREVATARLVDEVRRVAGTVVTATDSVAQSQDARAAARAQLLSALETAAGVPLVVEAIHASTVRDAIVQTGWPPTRWVQKLRADPLRTLGLRPLASAARAKTGPTTGEVPPELRRTSLPAASPAVKAQIATATRSYVAASTAMLPAAAAETLNSRAVTAAATVSDALDSAVAQTVEVRSPKWWAAVGWAQWLLLTAAVGGGLWLLALAILDYLRLPTEAFTPNLMIGEWALPVPTVLLALGIAAGLLLALLSRAIARAGAARRARRAAAGLRASVEEVGRRHILADIDERLEAWDRVRAAAIRAGS